MDGALTVGDLKRALSYLEDDDPRTIVLLDVHSKNHYTVGSVMVSPEDRVATVAISRISEPEFLNLLDGGPR